MTRAITSDELTKLRSDGQWSKLYLAIAKPQAVFACRVNQSFTTTDDIYEITYDGVTAGAYTDVLPGQTCYVGSSAGAYDLGMVRVRKAPTSTTLYIGETSEIQWTDNLYLTVVDEFGLWAKHWYASNETDFYMDRDIQYTDENVNFPPVPVLGPDIVLWLDGATIEIDPDASNSWVLGGSTIFSYQWAGTGTSFEYGMNTATPRIQYNMPGQYRLSCKVSAANGKNATGYRDVFAFNDNQPPVSDFVLESIAGEADGGGWQFTVTMYDQAALSDIRERTKVILFSRDTYGGERGGLGPDAGYENILCSGWVDEESIEWNAEQGAVKFTVKGPWYWLGKLAAFAAALKTTTSQPAEWRYCQDLTVDKMLHHLYHWRSTADAVMDCYPSLDSHAIYAYSLAPGSLWGQLKEVSEGAILASPICDRYGRLFVQTDSQFLASVDRASIPVVMDITKADWTDRIRIPRAGAGSLAMLETAGGGDNEKDVYYSRSRGTVPAQFGSMDKKDGLLASSQDDLNTLTGLIFAARNNKYGAVIISLAQNNRFLDIAPRQYVTLSIAPTDTERGITWTAKRLIPRRVSYVHDPETGALTTELECEAETYGPPGLTVQPPVIPNPNIPPYPVPKPNPIVPPPTPWFPPWDPTPPDPCAGSENQPTGPFPVAFDKSKLLPGETSYGYFPCTIRANTDLSPSRVVFDLEFKGDAQDHFGVGIIDSGKNVLSSFGLSHTVYGWEAYFSPSSPITIGGFALWVDAGGTYRKTAAISSGTIANPQTAGWGPPGAEVTGLTLGQLYCIEFNGGPFHLWDGRWNDIDYAGSAGLTDSTPSGNLGYEYYITNIYHGSAPDFALYSERVGPASDYGRFFWKAAQANVYLWCADSDKSNNSAGGSLGYTLYYAEPARQVIIRSCKVYNVCTG